MKEVNVLEALRQAPSGEVGQVFQEEMRCVIKESFISLMIEEARQLCGGFYHPDSESVCRRAGSADRRASPADEIRWLDSGVQSHGLTERWSLFSSNRLWTTVRFKCYSRKIRHAFNDMFQRKIIFSFATFSFQNSINA